MDRLKHCAFSEILGAVNKAIKALCRWTQQEEWVLLLHTDLVFMYRWRKSSRSHHGDVCQDGMTKTLDDGARDWVWGSSRGNIAS